MIGTDVSSQNFMTSDHLKVDKSEKRDSKLLNTDLDLNSFLNPLGETVYKAENTSLFHKSLKKFKGFLRLNKSQSEELNDDQSISL